MVTYASLSTHRRIILVKLSGDPSQTGQRICVCQNYLFENSERMPYDRPAEHICMYMHVWCRVDGSSSIIPLGNILRHAQQPHVVRCSENVNETGSCHVWIGLEFSNFTNVLALRKLEEKNVFKFNVYDKQLCSIYKQKPRWF